MTLSISEWSKAVKATVAGAITVGTIIGLYISVDSWADEKILDAKIEQIERAAEVSALNDINHDKIIQSNRIDHSEMNIQITEMKLEEVEDEIDERKEQGQEPTARQERSSKRLLSLLEAYEAEHDDATEKLTKITQSAQTSPESRP